MPRSGSLFLLKRDSQAQKKEKITIAFCAFILPAIVSTALQWEAVLLKVLNLFSLDLRGFFFFFPFDIKYHLNFFHMSYFGENLWSFFFYDLFNIRKFCFSWHFIALRIWNISIPDNKYYVIIIFIWIVSFLLFFSNPLSQLILQSLLILNCATQLSQNHI